MSFGEIPSAEQKAGWRLIETLREMGATLNPRGSFARYFEGYSPMPFKINSHLTDRSANSLVAAMGFEELLEWYKLINPEDPFLKRVFSATIPTSPGLGGQLYRYFNPSD